MKRIIIFTFFVMFFGSWILGQLDPKHNNIYNTFFSEPAQAQEVVLPSYCVGREEHCDALRKAGFNEEQTHIMIAIGMAESHLRVDAVGDQSLANSKWGYSYGAWQIRSLNNPGNDWSRDKNFLTTSLENQAKAAYVISGSGAFNIYPWSTTHNKDPKGRPITPAYLQYL